MFCTAKLEKTIALEIVNNEINVENEVTKKLSVIFDSTVTIQKQKRFVTRLMQEHESAKHKYQVNEQLIVPSGPKEVLVLLIAFFYYCILIKTGCNPHQRECIKNKSAA